MLGHGRAFACAFVATMLLVAGTAMGAVRYAEPGGNGPEPCNQSDPCPLQQAVESAASSDEVIVTAGDYTESDPLNVPPGVDVHGAAGQPRPRVISSVPGVGDIGVNLSGTLRDIEIELTGSATYALNLNAGAVAERLFVHSASGNTCNFFLGGGSASAVLRDSVCWNTLADVACAVCLTQGLAGTRTATLRNVTAVALQATSARALNVQANSGGANTIEAKNVIASAPTVDVAASATSPSVAAVTLAHSNYDTRDASGTGASITQPTTSSNQTAAPLLVNTSTGDFHQAPGSPTIDAGVLDASSGMADIDGESRSQGAAPDIGADEFVPPPAPPSANGDTFPPDTKILKGPRKRTKKRKAKFQFGGSEPGLTFECSLDERAFKPCRSPEKFRSLKRTKHEFAVRAVDAAGNRDPTPADRRWTIKKKKKR
jgi:hypothetical protein